MISRVLCALLAVTVVAAVDIQKDLTVGEAQREVDVSTQIAWSQSNYEIENNGAPTKYILHAIMAEDLSHLAYIEAKVDGRDAKTTATTVTVDNSDFAFFKIDLDKELAKGGKAKVQVTEWYQGKMQPHPHEITQSESQFVIFDMNAYPPCAYPMRRAKTTVKLAQGKLESATKVSPSENADGKQIYGAYDDVAALSLKRARLHFENWTPFLRVQKLERVIEVSHWGNIAIEEYIHIEHVGAKLNGPFSRYDYQRDQRHERQPSVAGFKTLLPASARDVYYRDEIGNISTSALRSHDQAVEVMIRPRFPLFGGWQTNYVLGYNVPSYEYLFTKGSNYLLRMRFLDHIYDNMIVDEITLKVILPERVRDINFKPPYDVKREKDEMHYTYLDYGGRPVITATKKNLIEKHIANFELSYTFDRVSMIYEPLMLVAAFVALFATVLVYVRLDFTIATNVATEQRAKVNGFVERVADAHATRTAAYQAWATALRSCAENRDVNAMTQKRKKAEIDARMLTQEISDLQAQIKPITPDVADKLNEVARHDRGIVEALSNHTAAVERFVNGKMQKPAYNEAERTFKQKFDECRERADALVYAL